MIVGSAARARPPGISQMRGKTREELERWRRRTRGELAVVELG